MCTVTYIPVQEKDFILTSNRDEQPSRSPENLSNQLVGDQKLVFPRDIQASGTWICMSSADRTVCLLNGAFKKHQHRPPYRRSRGLMVLDFFEYPDLHHFLKDYEFDGMEPFTMIIIEKGDLFELRWDGALRYLLQLDRQGHYLWSSSTLYPEVIMEKRQQWFRDWQEKRKDSSQASVMEFHRNAGEGDPWNDVIMNRNGVVRTVSITSIVKAEGVIEMHYYDLINDRVKQEKVPLKSRHP